MSQWYRKGPESELGPLSFPELVRMIRDGALREDDLVRRAEQSKWQRASDVIGLFRAARATQTPRDAATAKSRDDTRSPANDCRKVEADSERAPKAARRPPSQAASQERQGQAAESSVPTRTRFSQVSARTVIVISIVLVFVMGLGVAGWYSQREAMRFPLPAGVVAQIPAGHYFLGWGPLGIVEYLIVWADAVALPMFPVLWYFRMRAAAVRRSSGIRAASLRRR